MRTPPLISITLYAQNAQNHLRQQLDSLLAQDWPHVEIVVVDDACVDDTAHILAEYALKNNNLIYTRNAIAQGYTASFEWALAKCQGQWIAPCCEDDIWLPNKLSALATALIDTGSLLAFCDAWLVLGKPTSEVDAHIKAESADIKKFSTFLNLFSTDNPLTLFDANMAFANTMLFDRSLLARAQPFPKNLAFDWWLAYNAVCAQPIRYVDACLVICKRPPQAIFDAVAQSLKRQRRRYKPGFRWRELAQDGARYQQLARVPSTVQPLALSLVALWQARDTQFFSLRLAHFLWTYRQTLSAIQGRKIWQHQRGLISFGLGLKTKKILSPFRYQQEIEAPPLPTTNTVPVLISVALCTFNGERYLREQLDSILTQDWPCLEIVIIDDASTDATPAILTAYAQRYPCIRYTRNAQTLGFCKNFEKAVSVCAGRWIAPCDQDDIWAPHKLSTLASALESGDSLMVFCDSELILSNGRPMYQKYSDRLNMFDTDDPAVLLHSNMVSGHAMLFYRSLLKTALPFPSEFHDWWLAYVALSFAPIRYVDQPLVRYRQHAQSVTDITHSKTAVKRPADFKKLELAKDGLRFKSFASVPGKGQRLAQELSTLWERRTHQFISWRLAYFFYQHALRIFAIAPISANQKKWMARHFFWGLKTKKIVNPQRY